MPDEKGEPRETSIRQSMPWTELFRGFQIAIGFKKLLLAAGGIVAMTVGWMLLSLIFGQGNDPYYNRFLHWPGNEARGPNPTEVLRERTSDKVNSFAGSQVGVLMEPLWRFLGPVVDLLMPSTTRPKGFVDGLFLVLIILWTLATWAVFGGAITRIAAVQIARKEEKVGLFEALRFSWSKFLSFFSAPLLPFLGILVLCIFLIFGGAFLHINWLGDLLVPILFFLALIGGMFGAVILIGMVGWPLMHATISTEGSDSFDAISRSYSYVYQRPWHYLWYLTVSLAYGIALIFFVVFATSLLVSFTKWGVSLTPGLEYRDFRLTKLFVFSPESYGWQDMLLEGQSAAALKENMDWAQYAGAGIMAFWTHLVFLLMLGFAYSYFWCSSTIIYFLLRKEADKTDMDEVYLEEDDFEMHGDLASAPAAAPATSPTTLPMVEAPKAATPAPEPAKVATAPPPEPAPVASAPPEPPPTSEPIATPSGDGSPAPTP